MSLFKKNSSEPVSPVSTQSSVAGGRPSNSEDYELSSSLEGNQPTAIGAIDSEPSGPSPVVLSALAAKRRQRWIRFGILGITLIAGLLIVLLLTRHQSTTGNSASVSNVNNRFNAVNIPLENLSNTQTTITNKGMVSIDGQLNVNNALVLSPMSKPSNAVAGQLYYDQNSHQLSLYNGTSFVNILSGKAITSIDGNTGDISTGSGLSINNGRLSNTGVLSLQGQIGNLTLTGGTGIAVNGTTLSNTGVVSLGGRNGAITLGSGLTISGNQLQSSGIASITAGSNITVVSDGNGNVTISAAGGGGSGTVGSSGGTTNKLAKFTGVQSIGDSLISDNGTVVTIGGNLNVSGTVTLSTPLTVANGGTGATTPSGARTSLGAAASGANSDITSLSGLTTALSVGQGGTGVGTLPTNSVLVGNGTSAVSGITGANGSCLLMVGGTPTFTSCPIGGNVSGSGTGGTIPLWNGSGSVTALTDSILSQSGTTVTVAGDLNATNLSGNGTGVTNVNAAQLGGQAGSYYTNAANISSGTLSDSRLSTNVTLQGNTFNGANQLLQLNASGYLPALNGSLLTNVNAAQLNGQAGSYYTNASNINAGTLGDTYLSSNVTLQGNTFNAASQLVQLNASTQLPAVSGALLTNLNGSAITSGTVSNAYLTGNGALSVTAGTGLTGGGSVALGGSTTLNVSYGSVSGTAVQGNVTLTCAKGAGNLSGGGDTITLGSGGSCSDINITPTPNFNSVTVGDSTSTLGQLILHDGSTVNTGTIQLIGALSGNQIYSLPTTGGEVCIKDAGNCTGTNSGGVTTSGTHTQNYLTQFSDAGGTQITNSSIYNNATGVSIGSTSPAGLFNVGASNQFQVSNTGAVTAVGLNAGTGLIQGTGGLTVGGTVTLSNLTSTGGQCLTTDGSGVLSLVDCLSGAGGGSSGVASLNGLSGTLTINNASAAGSNITINDAKADGTSKGVAAFDSTNFTATAGVINTIQGIATTATPTFAGLTLNGTNFTTDGIVTSVSGSFASGTINLGTSTYLTGTLGVAKGGTGLSSLAANQLLYAGTASSISQLANGTSGQCLVSNGAGSAPSFQTCTGAGGVSSITATDKQTGDLTFSGTANQISVSNTGTTFTFATPQDIGTSSDVSFGTVNAATLLKTAGTTRIDASGNLSNIGTVTTSGLITGGSGLTISAGTITFSNLTGGSSTCLTLDASNHVGTAACATGGGSTPTLQDVYNNSGTTPVITLNTTGNGVRIQDASTPIGSDLFAVTNNGGTTKYFAVTVAGASVTGTLSATDFSGNGSGITNVDAVTLQGQNSAYYTNASNINAGTIGDAYLSNNVALYNRATSNFTGALQHNGNNVCDSSGNCTGVSGGAIGGSGTANTIAIFTGSGYTIGDSMLSQDAGKTVVTVSGALSVTGSLTLGTALSVADGGTGATTPSGARTSLGAAASGANSDITSLSGLTTALSVGQGGTGQTSFTANGVVFGNGTNGLQVTSAGSGGQILLANNLDVPTFATMSGDITIDSSGVTTIGAGKVTNAQLANSSLTVTAGTGLSGGGAVTLGGTTSLSVSYGSTAGTAVEGSTTLTCPSGTGNLSGGGNSITLGAGGSCNGITITNSPTFSGTLTVTGSGGTIIGQAGSIAGVLTLANSTNSNMSILKALAPTGTGDVTYNLPQVAGGTTQTVCTIESGNCAGSGSGVTGSGTSGKIAKFNGSGSIADSNLSESATTLTYTGNVVIQGNNSLQLGTAGPSGKDGAVSFANSLGTHTVTLQAPTSDPASNLTFHLPNAYGGNGSCLISDGSGGLSFNSCTGGAGGGVTSINSQTGVVTIANATASSGTITLNDAKADGITKGIAAFNATNFKDASGVINTAQDIATTSDVSFNSVTLTTALSILNGGTGATTNTGARTNLGAAASGANSDITSLSGLTTALSVGQGGTGATTLTANGVLIGNGTSAITAVAAGSTGQCLVSTASTPTWTTCPGSGGVTSVNGLSGVISIANASAAGSTITLNDAKADGSTKGIAAFSAGNFADNGSGLISIKTGGVTSTEIADGTIANADLAGGTYSGITGTGALSTGSIASGFGTIATVNTITGTVVNGITGINTGAGAGTERIDASGNLVNIGNISASGTITLSGLASVTGQCLVLDGSNHVGTATCATGSGSTPTMQDVYNNSAAGAKTITLANGSTNGVVIQDASTPLGANLFSIKDNTAATTYFAVTAVGASINGNLSATGTIQFGNLAAGAVLSDASGNISSGTIDLASSTYVSGVLGVNNGGTGASSFASTNGSVYFDGSKLAATGAGTTGQCLLANTGSAPSFGTCTGAGGVSSITASTTQSGALTLQGTTDQVSVTNSGAIFTFATAQNIGTTSTPTFGGLTLNGALQGTAASFSGANTVSLGTAGTSTGSIKLFNGTGGSTGSITLVAANPGSTNYILSIPTLTANADICVSTGGCAATGAAGGDLTGNYPNPTIAKLQGSTLTISSPVAGQVLNYNGTAWINTSSPTIAGLLTVNGGLTATGAVNINTSGAAGTTIGNASSTTTVNGQFNTGVGFNLGNFVYSSYGGFDYSVMLKNNFVSIGLDHSSSDDYIDLTGNTNISANSDEYSHGALLVYNNYANAINPVTTIQLGATPTSTGDALRIQNSSGAALSGFNYQGNLYYKNGSYTSTIATAALTGNQTITLPNASGTVALTNDTTNFIRNQTTLQTGNFNIKSTAANQVTAAIQGAASQTAEIFQATTIGGVGNDGLHVKADGTVAIVQGNSSATALTIDALSGLGGGINVQSLHEAIIASSANTSTAVFQAYTSNIGSPTVVVKQMGASSDDLLQIQNSGGGGLVNVSSTGLLTANGGATIGIGQNFVNGGSTLNSSKALSLGASGAIGTAAATVDAYTTFDVTATAASLTFTIPSPTVTTSGRLVYINNVGATNSFVINGATVNTGASANFIWNGSAWTTTAVSTGVSIVGAFALTSQPNGASISGNTITFGPADATNPGMVSTGAQTFAGNKSFINDIVIGNKTTGVASKISLVEGGGSTNVINLMSAGATGVDHTIYLPPINGTLCLDSGNCDGSGGTVAGTGYIVNQSSTPATIQSGNFNISGTGIVRKLVVAGTPTANATQSLIQIGNAISGGNAVANGGTYIGLNAPSTGAGSAADLINLQNNGTSMFKVDNAGNVTIGNLAANSNLGSGSLDVNHTLTVDSGPGGCAIATTINGSNDSGSIAANGACMNFSIDHAYNGGVSINGAVFDPSANFSTGGTITTSTTGKTALLVTGAPTASATSSLIQIGSAIQGGNANGTYIGLNAPSSGAGSAADLMNLQKNNSSLFKIATNGDTSVTGIVTIGSGINTISLNSTGGYTASGTARHTKYITLPAEYAGAVLDAASDTGGANCSTNNSGIMASGFDSSAARQNFYEWVSNSGTNCYDVVVQIPIPADFSGWNGAPTLYMSNSAGTANAVCAEAIDTAGNIDSSYGGYVCSSPTTTLTSTNLTVPGGAYTAGGYMTMKIRLTSASNTDITKIGTLKLPYYSSF